jgi:hypothetical protein
MAEEEKSQGKKMKEITIKLNVCTLRKTIYVLIIIVLVGIIFAQQLGYVPTNGLKFNFSKSGQSEKASAIVGTMEENETTNATASPSHDDNESDVEESSAAEAENQENATSSANETSEPEEKLLSITGEITFEITDVKHVVKSDDFATITAVKYTIINQKKDFMPVIIGYFYDDNDDKEYVEETIILPELKAGKQITIESPVHVGYNEINKTKTLKLVLQDDKENALKIATIVEKFN